MHEYFGGWKRKVGAIALALATLLGVVWCRSLNSVDVLQFPSSGHSMEHCVSIDGMLIWGRLRVDESRRVIAFPVWSVSEASTFDAFLTRANLHCTWRGLGLGVGELNADPPANLNHTFWLVSQVWLVGPLVLLAIWLLLSRPGRSELKETPSK